MDLVDENIPKEIKFFEGEEILLAYRRKYISFLIIVIIAGIISMGIMSSIYFFLMMNSSDFVNFLGILLLLIISSIIFLSAILGIWYTRSHRFYLTNERIIIYKKFVSIAIRDVWFERITDFIVDQGPIGRIANYGNIVPITAGIEIAGLAMAFLSFLGVEDPYKVREDIQDIKQKILKKEG